MKARIQFVISESIKAKQSVLEDRALLSIIEKVVKGCIETFDKKGKILFCGNGGSAADAQHIAGGTLRKIFYR